MASNFTYELVRHIADISQRGNDWVVELNIVKWGKNPASFDIRKWGPDHMLCGKGISLTKQEIIALRDALNQLEV